ncbi:MAG: response regulator, partial [Lachnospiraceae bacterium]|nr:response regulator [Lachnospiraceae bacterium]
MKKILLCSNTEGTINEIEDIIVSASDFEIIVCEQGIDIGAGIAENEKADLLIINLSDLADNSHMSILKLQTALPGIAILAYGTTLEYTNFLAKYVGGGIHHLEKPLEVDKVVATIGRALSLNDEELTLMRDSLEHKGEGENAHILLVDDNALSLRGIRSMLSEKYKVSLITSGDAAIKFIKQKKPDLVLLDYEMPVMDGRAVLEQIRADREISGTKVIFLTGKNDKNSISSAMALKPEGYLLKPIEKKQLDA